MTATYGHIEMACATPHNRALRVDAPSSGGSWVPNIP
jgi:hypothetical protein